MVLSPTEAICVTPPLLVAGPIRIVLSNNGHVPASLDAFEASTSVLVKVEELPRWVSSALIQRSPPTDNQVLRITHRQLPTIANHHPSA